jgi:hypothetical protein
MVDEKYYRHNHDGVNTEQIDGRNLRNSPQESLSTQVGGTLSSGGAGTLSTGDSQILASVITRLNELEDRLKKLGFIK